MTEYQESDSDIFKTHRDSIAGYIEQMLIPFCEEYIGLVNVFIADKPELAAEYKITGTPAYIFSLTDKILKEFHANLVTLNFDEHNEKAVSDMKKHLELLKNELTVSMTKLILTAEGS